MYIIKSCACPEMAWKPIPFQGRRASRDVPSFPGVEPSLVSDFLFGQVRTPPDTYRPKPFPLLVQLEFGSFFSLPSAFCFLLLPHAAQSGRQAGSQLRVGVGDKRALPHTYIRQLRETPNQSDGMDGCVRNASDAECGLTIPLQRGRHEARQTRGLS